MATLGLLRNGRGTGDPQVAKGLAFLEGFVQQGGGIHGPESGVSNYETCVALVCLKEANRQGRFDKALRGAEAFLRSGQWNEAKGKERTDLYYGGAGYGGATRPDLSNTAFLIDALKSCGAGSEGREHPKSPRVRLPMPEPL